MSEYRIFVALFVPAFRAAGDVTATLSVKPQLGGDGFPVAAAGDVACAPANHFGIIGSFRSAIEKNAYLYPTYDKPSNYSFNNKSIQLNSQRIEVGGGYFTGFGSRGIFEAFAGYGNGVAVGRSFFSTHYNRFFLQPEAGYKGRVVSVMGGFRVAMQHYYDFESPDSTLRYKINFDRNGNGTGVDFLSETFVFVEPFVNAEVGVDHFFFNLQLGFTAQTGKYATITSDFPVYCSVGISYHLKAMEKRRSKRQPLHSK